MTFLVHLSDLHMTRSDRAQSRLFDKLLEALRTEHEKARPERTTVFITGDVFDSGTDPPAPLVEVFLDLHARMLEVLGNAFTVVLPGNHDRRKFGLLGPNRAALFSALHRAADPARMHVLGQRTPFLAEGRSRRLAWATGARRGLRFDLFAERLGGGRRYVSLGRSAAGSRSAT